MDTNNVIVYAVLLIIVFIYILIKFMNKNNFDNSKGITKIIKEDDIKKDYPNFNKSLFLFEVGKVFNKLELSISKGFKDRLPRLITDNLLSEYTSMIDTNINNGYNEHFEKAKILSSEICDYNDKKINVLLEIEDLYYVKDGNNNIIRGDIHSTRSRRIILTIIITNITEKINFKIDNIDVIEENYIKLKKGNY